MLAGIILIIWDLFKEAFTEWVEGLWESIKEAFDEFVGKIKQWFEDVVQPIIDKVMEFIQPVIDAVKKVVEAVGNWFREKIDWFAQTFPETFAFIKNIIDKVMGVVNKLKEKYDALVKGIKKFFGKEEKPAAAPEKPPVAAPPKPPKEKELVLDERGIFVEKKPTAPVETAPPPAPIIVPPPVGAPSAPPTAPAPPPTPPKAEKVPAPKKEEKPLEVSGVQATIVKSLNDSGITSPKAHANVLATVKAESNFKVQSENLTYSSPERIQAVFGPRRIPSTEFAQQFVKNPEALANYVYKTTDGNSAPGDGFKYRGRGFIQHTGKNQYSAISKFTGVDVLSNPDALNSPDVAAKAIPWFLLSYKRLKPDDVENMSKVNKAIAFADPTGKKAAERESSAQQIYASMSGSPTGTQVASASSAVAAGQREQQKPVTPVVVNASTTNNKVVNRTEVAQSAPPKDTATTLAARVA
jgi:putative chitinase